MIKKNQSKKGQAVIEYAGALLLGTIVVAVAITVFGTTSGGTFGTMISGVLTKISTYFSSTAIPAA
jgi:Flp pilus assembly pilin Flp